MQILATGGGNDCQSGSLYRIKWQGRRSDLMARKGEKKVWVDMVSESLRPIVFRGALLSTTSRPVVTVARRDVAHVVYRTDPDAKRNVVDEVYDTLPSVAEDWSEWAHLVCLGARTPSPQVWDAKSLTLRPLELEDKYVYGTDIEASGDREGAWAYLVSLASGDESLAEDYLQAIAPLLMGTRPDGVIWFVGDGANGKSGLLNALYMMFGAFFSSLTLAAIEDGRAISALNGKLGNIVRESSEARIEDSEAYKSIGTHEPITMRLMRSNDTVSVDTNLHTIFNANTVPTFADKTKGARRRTWIVPFPAHFPSNPTFERETFTASFLGGLMELVLETTHKIRDNNYRYDWSKATQRAKGEYDSGVNSAEAFVAHLVEKNILGFSNYSSLRLNYDNWCALNGYEPLRIGSLKRAVLDKLDVESRVVRVDDKISSRWLIRGVDPSDVEWLEFEHGGYALRKSDSVHTVPQQTPLTTEEDW